eukprot:GHVU01120358.1.p1 GENE.GHVU01120358.1~~GHVU01120358.1.p1  ORF type:complete len:179 (+),score=24.68 GHVU01120358.1:68-604(+)
MQFSVILSLTLGLAASTLANPLSDKYSTQVKRNVTEQIQIWQNAIDTVNTFVDTVLLVTDPAEVSRMAATAFAAAQNEQTSNAILSGEITLDASGEAASKALIPQFGVIGPAINETIYQPQNVQKNVDTINKQRCAPPRGEDAISREGCVQEAAASAVGILILPPKTPIACYFPAPTN